MNSWLTVLNKAYALLIGAYLGGLLGLTAAGHIIRRPELRGLLRTARALLLLPAWLLVIPGLLLQRWAFTLLLVPPALAFVPSWGALLRPRSATLPGAVLAHDAMPLTVLTYNLQAPDAEGAVSRATVIRRADADVVALQELSADAVAHLAAALKGIYPHQALHPQENRFAGQGVLSRYPIVSDEYWQHPDIPRPLGHQRVELDVNGARVTLHNAHPVPPYSIKGRFRLHQHSLDMAALLRRVARDGGPLIVAGDLNLTAQFAEYARLSERLADAFVEAGRGGLGFTFPVSPRTPPMARLDHIFCGGGIEPLDAHALSDSGGSDHRPVWARLALIRG
jgi:endonuclease/exonuclease/phosphatase (EEP) superfamily protein YafD